MYQVVMLFLVVYRICHLLRKRRSPIATSYRGGGAGLQSCGGLHGSWEMVKGSSTNIRDQIQDSEIMTFVSPDLGNSSGLEIVNKTEMHKHQATGD